MTAQIINLAEARRARDEKAHDLPQLNFPLIAALAFNTACWATLLWSWGHR
jgi:hypothetical protein